MEDTMAKDDVIEFEGTILEALPSAMFRVELENRIESCLCCNANSPVDHEGEYVNIIWIFPF